MKNTLKGLNDSQMAAVTYVNGPSLILAGAGSGKTRVLTHKAMYLIEHEHVDPKSIIMITFTNKAAAEMQKRNPYALGYIGTFHSLCAVILRRNSKAIGRSPDYIIFDEDDQLSLIRTIVKEKSIVNRYSPSFFLHKISNAKNILIGPEKYLGVFSDYSAESVSEVYREYERRMVKANALDFDDLILKTVRLFEEHEPVLVRYQNKYHYIFVDEFHDTNFAQYRMTMLLGQMRKMVTVVGDFSQSIYSWRGADIQNLEKFQSDFSQVRIFNLNQNYRSSQQILDFAYEVISQNETHPVLQLVTENAKGDEVTIYEAESEEDEARFVADEIEKGSLSLPFDSFAILYRTNAQSRAFEEVFLHRGIPYLLVGGTRFYERKEIKDVLAYVRLLINDNDEVAEKRIMKMGKRKYRAFHERAKKLRKLIQTFDSLTIIEKILEETRYTDQYLRDNPEDFDRLENINELKSVASQFSDIFSFLEQIALVESEYFEYEKKQDRKGVRLMTMHQAKGLEFETVFIVGAEEGILPHFRSTDDYYKLEEERRLLYVGVTRAMKKLFVTYAKRRYQFGRAGEGVISRFLKERTDEW